MRCLILLILFCSILRQSNADKKQAGEWETLDGCRLVESSLDDGDSFLVECGDEQHRFRIYWVDAPECTRRNPGLVSEQADYFSLTEEQVIDAGKSAKRFTRKRLSGEFTVHTRWKDAREDLEPCYFAIIEKDAAFLSQDLVAHGWARIYGKPTTYHWPSGPSPRSYLARLKSEERRAQLERSGTWSAATASMQLAGLQKLRAGGAGNDIIALEQATSHKQNYVEVINVNTAPLETLETLPGIGPVLGQRMIAARPFDRIESLVEIPGISANTLAGFRHLIVTEDPPPPEKTVAFYMADLERYLGQEVPVVVQRVEKLERESPEGFRAVDLVTAYQGVPGGRMTTYLPEEFYDAFIQSYAEPGKEFTGLLYEQDDEVVLVYRRK